MRERKFAELIAEYPNLVDGRFAISHSQAQAIIDGCGDFPTLEETILNAKRRSTLPDSPWEAFDGLLVQKKARTSHSERTSDGRSFFKAHPRLAITLAIILALVSFFTVTPVGRAMASELHDFVLEFHHGGYTITPLSEVGKTVIPAKPVPANIGETEYSTYDELQAATDYIIYRPDYTDGMTQDYLKLATEYGGIVHYAVFHDSQERYITIIQDLEIWSKSFGAHAPGSKEWDGYLADGTPMHCSLDSIDGSLCAIGEWNDTILTIYVQDGIDYSNIIFEKKP